MRIEKRNGMYRAQVMVDGKRISITRETEAEVKKAVEEAKKGKEIVAADLTVYKAVDIYITEREAVLSPSTVSGYKAMQRVRFQSMMPRRVISITPRQWQTAVSDEARIVGAKTVKNAWGLISAALAYNGFEVPQVHMPQAAPHEHEFLDPDQIPLFLRAIEGKRVEVPALLALHGLRKSELLAMTWDKIDLGKKQMVVSGALVKNADRQYVLKDTNKNTSSSRIVPIIIPRLVELLQDADRSKPVVTYRPSSIFNAINDACDEAGLPRVGVHGLRHSAVSLAYSIGMNELSCMSMFGYSDFNTMRRIYTHLAQRDMDRGMKNMQTYFEKAGMRKITGAVGHWRKTRRLIWHDRK